MRLRSFLAAACATALVAGPGSAQPPGGPANHLSAADRAAGWRLLFDGKTTQGWSRFRGNGFPVDKWKVEEGWLVCLAKGGGDVVAEGHYDQFELEWEWKLAPGGNSGVKYFVLDSRNSPLGHEYQMLDDQQAAGKHRTGSFYDVLAPDKSAVVKPPGQINRSRIMVRGHRVEHWLNEKKVLEYTLGSPALEEALAQSKFKDRAGFGERAKGRILLQDHGSGVQFRNIRIRELPADR